MPLPYRWALLATLALCPFAGRAASTPCPQAETIIQNAYPKAISKADGIYTADGARIELPWDGALPQDEPHAVICKAWPAHPELTLAAVPLIRNSDEDSNTGDLDMLVLDTRTLHVRHRLRLPDRMSDDAVSIDELSFDTARYRLSATTTAFGLRVSMANNSRASPSSETDLLLFAILDGKLRTLLNSLVVAQNNGSWDENCAGTFSTTTAVLGMASTSHAGFADIAVTSEDTNETSTADGNDCKSTSDKDHTKTLLTFDGQAYRIPPAMAATQ